MVAPLDSSRPHCGLAAAELFHGGEAEAEKGIEQNVKLH